MKLGISHSPIAELSLRFEVVTISSAWRVQPYWGQASSRKQYRCGRHGLSNILKLQATFLYAIYHQRAGKTNLFHMRGGQFHAGNMLCTFDGVPPGCYWIKVKCGSSYMLLEQGQMWFLLYVTGPRSNVVPPICYWAKVKCGSSYMLLGQGQMWFLLYVTGPRSNVVPPICYWTKVKCGSSWMLLDQGQM